MKVYEYGGHAPIINGALVEEQARKAHRYYNRLIEIERQRKVKMEELLLRDPTYAAAVTAVAELQAELAKTRKAIEKAKQKAKHEVATPIETARAKVLKKDLGAAYKKANAERKRVLNDETFKVAIERVNTDSHDAHIAARAACSEDGLYWGNYLVCEDAWEAAKKPPKRAKNWRPKKSRPSLAELVEQAEHLSAEKLARERWMPKFKRWDGRAHLQVQIQHGISVKEAFSCQDSRFQLVPVADEVYSLPKKERKRPTYTTARMRIGSDQKRNPVWAEFHIHLHRPLPADGVIKRAHLIRERIATKCRWKLQLSVESNEIRTCPPGNGSVGIDIGWRQFDDGVRVAYWCDHKEQHGEFKLNQRQLSAITKADSLRSIRDRNLEELKVALSEWKKSTPVLPEWLREPARMWHSWRAAARFVSLSRKWAGQRFKGDGLIFMALSAWAKQDLHLWQWQENQRDKALRARREQFRLWAADLASRYNEVVLEGDKNEEKLFDLRPLVEQAAPEEEQDRAEKARHNRTLAATANLRTCIVQAFLARGRNIRYRDRAGTTERCNWCGKEEERTDALMQTCSCGRTWDRDENAARNIVGSKKKPDAEKKPPKERKGRWQRRKEEKAARDAAPMASPPASEVGEQMTEMT